MNLFLKIFIGLVVIYFSLNFLSMSIDSRYSILPQPIENLGRNITHFLQGIVNGLMGKEQPVDPRPYKNQLSNPLH
tara:strand:- start:348 stop:575 length:228 start_codon:yes stop_codon:yes gene_type:complete